MNILLREHADTVVSAAIQAVKPDEAVRRALEGQNFSGRVVLVAAGKAAWQMAKAAHDCLGSRIESGIVITKYDHVIGEIANFDCREAGHPVPDENSFAATQAALELVENLSEDDTVLFLLSGGGSALFEKPLISGEALQDITNQLLACGADIVEINTIRKRLSAVKGGRFAQICAPARVFSIVLSDILGDPLDMIASGPAYPDRSTCEQAIAIAEKYQLRLPDEAKRPMHIETPKTLDNVTTQITGSVRELCSAAEKACAELGYESVLLTDQLCCQAKEAGSFMASILKTYARPAAKIWRSSPVAKPWCSLAEAERAAEIRSLHFLRPASLMASITLRFSASAAMERMVQPMRQAAIAMAIRQRNCGSRASKSMTFCGTTMLTTP